MALMLVEALVIVLGVAAGVALGRLGLAVFLALTASLTRPRA